MLKFVFLFTVGLFGGLEVTSSQAMARIPDGDHLSPGSHESLYTLPQQIDFEVQFCSPNQYIGFENEPTSELKEICWLRSRRSFLDGEFPEALEVTWIDGRTHLFFLSTFAFNLQFSRYYGSQILRATIVGQGSQGLRPSLSYVYKEYASDSGIGRESRPDQIMGTLPSGERFLIKRPPDEVFVHNL